MRLVEKKCPNCGAGLSFNDNDTSVKCEYCNKTYYIEKDEKKSQKVDAAHLGDAYRFVNEAGKPIIKGFAYMYIIVFVFVFVMIMSVVFMMFRSFNNFGFRNQGSNKVEQRYEEYVDEFFKNDDKNKDEVNTDEEDNDEVDKEKYVLKISEIDKVSLETFHDNSISQLGAYNMNNKSYTVTGDWKSCGVYLLVHKDKKQNILYDVFKHTYKHNSTGKKVVLYAAVEYKDLKLTDNNIVNHDYRGVSSAPSIDLDGDTLNFAFGYESVEKLYNKLVRNKSGDYSIEASNGLYKEN